jgi:hypothetical protein
MVNIVLSSINNLNFIISSMDWDSTVNDVTGYRLNPRVSISDKRGLLAASSIPPTFRVPRRAKTDACHSSSSSVDGFKILYYYHTRWMHLLLLRHRRTLPVTIRAVKAYGGVEV